MKNKAECDFEYPAILEAHPWTKDSSSGDIKNWQFTEMRFLIDCDWWVFEKSA